MFKNDVKPKQTNKQYNHKKRKKNYELDHFSLISIYDNFLEQYQNVNITQI